MRLRAPATVVLTLAAALALTACDTAPTKSANQQAASEAAANAARAQQEAAEQAKAKADEERAQKIAAANQSARNAKFVAQPYSSWNDKGNVTLNFTKNGKVVWEEPGNNGGVFTMQGNWRLQKGQVHVRLYNKADKKTELFSFVPKVALIAPSAEDADCKALPGLLPVSANGKTDNLNNIYLWPKAQVEKNQGSCIQQ